MATSHESQICQLPLSAVARWTKFGDNWMPVSVDVNCPFCTRLVNLTCGGHHHDRSHETIAMDARCPGCGKTSRLWVLEPGPASDPSRKGCACLWIYPLARAERQPIPEVENMPPALAHVYKATCQAYNAGLWAPCAVSCRRTLEGLVKLLITDAEVKPASTLADQLKQLPGEVNLAEPLLMLAENVRKGGNLGAHFDLEKEPDQGVAEAMVDLLEYFLEYVYALEQRAIALEDRIEKLGADRASATPEPA